MFKDLVLEMSAIKGDLKLAEDFSDYFSIRKITDDDRQRLSDLAVRFSKSSDVHQLALINSIEKTYKELVQERSFVETSKKIVQDLFNSVTKLRYFITDAIKYVLFKIWDVLPKSIKDPVTSLYTTYFEQHVLKLVNFFNNYIIVVFGIRIKLSEFIKNMFMMVSAGLIIHYLFFKSEGKVGVPIDESVSKSTFAYAYSNTFIFIEAWSRINLIIKENDITATSIRDIPERPKPNKPYGSEDPKTVYERIVEFFAEIGNEIRKTIASSIGKLVGLLIVIPLLVITIIGLTKLVNKMEPSNTKNFLSSSLTSICRILKISIEEKKTT